MSAGGRLWPKSDTDPRGFEPPGSNPGDLLCLPTPACGCPGRSRAGLSGSRGARGARAMERNTRAALVLCGGRPAAQAACADFAAIRVISRDHAPLLCIRPHRSCILNLRLSPIAAAQRELAQQLCAAFRPAHGQGAMPMPCGPNIEGTFRVLRSSLGERWRSPHSPRNRPARPSTTNTDTKAQNPSTANPVKRGRIVPLNCWAISVPNRAPAAVE